MHYKKLLFMIILSFIAMYTLMYLMVDQFAHVYTNLNQLYMASVMTTAMIIIELLVMRAMYDNRLLNIVIIVLSILIFMLSIIFIRNQTAISDREFLKSMIPHHAAALLMCKKAILHDSKIQALCKNISVTQKAEINFMQSKLKNI